MSRDLRSNEEWLEYDGALVTIDRRTYRLRASSFFAIYPYKHTAITVAAIPLNKRSEHYLAVKAELGDDWDTDVLESSPEFQASILRQLRTPQIHTRRAG